MADVIFQIKLFTLKAYRNTAKSDCANYVYSKMEYIYLVFLIYRVIAYGHIKLWSENLIEVTWKT
jgi:hypothetical protein